jgi:hypothetical protein
VELADVVAHVPQRGADLVGELTGAGHALLQRAKDVDAEGVRQRLDDAWVRDVRSGLHAKAAPGVLVGASQPIYAQL